MYKENFKYLVYDIYQIQQFSKNNYLHKSHIVRIKIHYKIANY